MLKDKNKIALTFAENGEIAGIALATIKNRTVRSIYIDAIFVLNNSVGGDCHKVIQANPGHSKRDRC